MNIVIYEKDKQYSAYIAKTLDEYMNKNHINASIIRVYCADDIKNHIGKPETALYFICSASDNEEAALNTAARIRENDCSGSIVFISGSGTMMPLVYKYKIEALDYIIKGSHDEKSRICSALAYACKRQRGAADNCLTIQSKQENFSVPFDDICAIDTIKSSHKLVLHHSCGAIEYYGLLKETERQLDGRFIRIHKSVIVNRDKIVSIDKTNRIVRLSDGEKYMYSVRNRKFLRQ